MRDRYSAYIPVVDEEDQAIRGFDQQDDGPDVPPLCPRCRRRDVFWTSDNKFSPLCERDRRSGSWLICDACANEAQVCVNDAAPLDGSSEEPVPWLAEVAAVARREREEAQFGRSRGPGRHSARGEKR